jgi:hypothetical protein
MNSYGPDKVVLELSRDDFLRLIMAIGLAGGAAKREGLTEYFRTMIRLANTINQGNPGWTPYEEARVGDVSKTSETLP